jgi:hypothetical protein
MCRSCAAARGPLRLAVGRWTAVLNGGNAYDAHAMTAALESSGLREL